MFKKVKINEDSKNKLGTLHISSNEPIRSKFQTSLTDVTLLETFANKRVRKIPLPKKSHAKIIPVKSSVV